jgi:hypothetical protein
MVNYKMLRAMRNANKAASDSFEKTLFQMQAQTTAQRTTAKAITDNFQVEQRPYVVTGSPEFVSSTVNPGKTSANFAFRNIGRMPAIEIRYQADFLRSYSVGNGQAQIEKNFIFMQENFGRLIHELDKAATQKYYKFARSDLAPNDSRFDTKDLREPISAIDIPNLTIGKLALFYIGIIRYTDAYKGNYETTFCYFYFGTDWKTWHVCDNHNVIK